MLGRIEHYIDGTWVKPLAEADPIRVVNPATEEVIGIAARGSVNDIDLAVKAARRAFADFQWTSLEERVALLERIIKVYESRAEELARIVSVEMGSPITFSRQVQITGPLGQFREAIETLKNYPTKRTMGGAEVLHEPIGVCGLITAWNWPIMLIAVKVAYGLAAGCTLVLKPSEVSPLSAMMFAEIMHEAGTPPGVFNLVNGEGHTVGNAVAAHPQIDMVSFTGSTRGGILVAQAAAETVKRVHQELGGKSANIILPDADLKAAVSNNLRRAFSNSGQSCQAPTRMLVDKNRYEEALEYARVAAEQFRSGDPLDPDTVLGPVVTDAQYRRIQGLIETGLAEGGRLVVGGPGRPEGLNRGYFVRPTIFGDVTSDMTIAQTEIFGPVLPILAYSEIDEAIEIANATPYGLASYIQSPDRELARSIASKLRSGRVYINTMDHNFQAPFGGYKQSGNGREQGELGLEEFMEVKSIIM